MGRQRASKTGLKSDLEGKVRHITKHHYLLYMRHVGRGWNDPKIDIIRNPVEGTVSGASFSHIFGSWERRGGSKASKKGRQHAPWRLSK